MTLNRSSKAIVSLAVVVLGACARPEAPEKTPDTITAPLVSVTAETLPRLHPYAGTVRAANVAPLSARIAGEVVAVHVTEGDRVRRGQVLVEIDAREIGARLAQARAAQSGGASAVDSASAAVASAEAQATLAETTWKRYSALRQRNSVSIQEYDEVEARYRSAAAELERARRAKAQLVAQSAAASAARSEAETFSSYALIRAPFDGVVSARTVDPGAQAAPGMALLTIDSGSQYRVETTIDEAATLAAGQEVLVESGGASVKGRVTHVVPALDSATRTALVKIALPSGAWRSGAYARVLVPSGSDETLTIPASALMRRGGLTSVFVVGEKGTAQLRLVTAGQTRGDRVEVLSGVAAGERVVATISNEVREGVRVNGARA